VTELPGDLLGRLAFVDEQRREAGSQIAEADSLRAVIVPGGEASLAGRSTEGAVAPVVPRKRHETPKFRAMPEVS
jgi:hypothetical protein